MSWVVWCGQEVPVVFVLHAIHHHLVDTCVGVHALMWCGQVLCYIARDQLLLTREGGRAVVARVSYCVILRAIRRHDTRVVV